MTTTQLEPCGTLAPVFVAKVNLVRTWANAIGEELKGWDDIINVDLSEVRNTPCDGFIPYTDGGFDVVAVAAMSYAYGSGHVPTAIQPYLDGDLKRIAEEWDEQNPDRTVAWMNEPELEELGQLRLPIAGRRGPTTREKAREEYYEFENTWMSEGGTYFYKVRALFLGDHSMTQSETGEPEVLLCVGINTDFEYGRDNIPWLSCYGQKTQQTNWLWEKTVKIDDLTSEMIDTFIGEVMEALRNA